MELFPITCTSLNSLENYSKTVKSEFVLSAFQNDTRMTGSLLMVSIRLFLCFSLFCISVQVGFEPRKLQNKQKKISVKNIFSVEFSLFRISFDDK
jgi:hypothetical protein